MASGLVADMDRKQIAKALADGGTLFNDRWPSTPQFGDSPDAERNAFRHRFWGEKPLQADPVYEGQYDMTAPGGTWDKGHAKENNKTNPKFKSREVDRTKVREVNIRGVQEALEMLVPKKKPKGPNDHRPGPLDAIGSLLEGME
jgi:hypothetical protein